jgi:hypothetical protein
MITNLETPDTNAINYLFELDASELSGLEVPDGATFFLDFQLSGDNVGFRTFRNSPPVVSDPDPVSGIITDTGEHNWPSIGWWGAVFEELAFDIRGGASFNTSGAAAEAAWNNFRFGNPAGTGQTRFGGQVPFPAGSAITVTSARRTVFGVTGAYVLEEE